MNEKELEHKQDKLPEEFLGFKLSENVAIAAVPLIAYSLIFAYESGYFYVFKLPYQFISFDLAEVFVASSALLGVAFTFFTILNPLSEIFLNKKIPPIIVYKIRSYIPVFLVFLPALISFKAMRLEWISFGVSIIALMLGDFVTPIFKQRNLKSYLAKIARADEFKNRSEKKEHSLVHKLIQSMGRNRAKTIFYFIMTLYIAFQIGRSIALQQTEFLIVNTNPEAAVLYITKNQAIVAPFNRITKELEAGFMVIDFSQSSRLSFHKERVGPLQKNISQSNP